MKIYECINKLQSIKERISYLENGLKSLENDEHFSTLLKMELNILKSQYNEISNMEVNYV